MKYLISTVNDQHVNPSLPIGFSKNHLGVIITRLLIILLYVLITYQIIILMDWVSAIEIYTISLALSIIMYYISDTEINEADLSILYKYNVLSKREISKLLIWEAINLTLIFLIFSILT